MTIDFLSASPAEGEFPARWVHGAKPPRGTQPTPLQVYHYNAHTVILRQDRSVSAEAPFLYLLFGNERALLLDTGATRDATRFPLRSTLDVLIADWLARNPRDAYELVVAHSHGHGDHVAGDGQFAGRDHTVIVDREAEAVRTFFGLADPPGAPVQFDLGGRVLELMATPGHHPASISIYDRWSGLLLTGDTLYPGRLYAPDMPAFVDSLERLAVFAESHPVSHVLGCHIEMTRTPGKDYPVGVRRQPDEPPLEMTLSQLVAARDAARLVAGRPGAHRFDDFIIYNGACRWPLTKLLGRGLAARLTRR